METKKEQMCMWVQGLKETVRDMCDLSEGEVQIRDILQNLENNDAFLYEDWDVYIMRVGSMQLPLSGTKYQFPLFLQWNRKSGTKRIIILTPKSLSKLVETQGSLMAGDVIDTVPLYDHPEYLVKFAAYTQLIDEARDAMERGESPSTWGNLEAERQQLIQEVGKLKKKTGSNGHSNGNGCSTCNGKKKKNGSKKGSKKGSRKGSKKGSRKGKRTRSKQY